LLASLVGFAWSMMSILFIHVYELTLLRPALSLAGSQGFQGRQG